MKQTISLCGFKHVGKSTIGRKIANKLNVELIDLDELVRRTIDLQTVYRTLGEEGFRQREYEMLETLDFKKRQLICLGGGTLSYGPSLSYLLEKSYLIQLTAPYELVKQRVLRAPCSFIDPARAQESFDQFYQLRHQVFNQLCIPKFDAVHKQEELFEFILSYLNLERVDVRK